jgi:hypothetical protein
MSAESEQPDTSKQPEPSKPDWYMDEPSRPTSFHDLPGKLANAIFAIYFVHMRVAVSARHSGEDVQNPEFEQQLDNLMVFISELLRTSFATVAIITLASLKIENLFGINVKAIFEAIALVYGGYVALETLAGFLVLVLVNTELGQEKRRRHW